MVRQEIIALIRNVLQSLEREKLFQNAGLSIPKEKIIVEYSEEKSHGDYATNIAMQLSGVLKKKPVDLAKILRWKIQETSPKNLFEKIEVADPGFINLFVSKNYWQKGVRQILRKEEKFGNLKIGAGKKTLVEFISANPSGQLHVGNGRGAFFGDVLSRVLLKAGYRVEREFYINDAKVSKQIQELGKTALGRGESYLSPYLRDLIIKFQPQLSEFRSETDAGYFLGVRVMKDLKKFIEKKLGIKFDNWVSEEDLYKKGLVIAAYEMLKKRSWFLKKRTPAGFLWERWDRKTKCFLGRTASLPTFYRTSLIITTRKNAATKK